MQLRYNAFASLIFILLICGCKGQKYDGPPRAEVTGKITLDGQPVPTGIVTLMPDGSGKFAGGSIVDGTYLVEEAKGPITGKYKVSISCQEETGEFRSGGPESGEPIYKERIPAKYNTNSTLTLEINAEDGPVVHDFELTSN